MGYEVQTSWNHNLSLFNVGFKKVWAQITYNIQRGTT